MKTNLAYFPYAQTAGEMEAWVRKLKRELREYRKQLWDKYQTLMIPSVEGPKLRRVIDFIDKEILGDEV